MNQIPKFTFALHGLSFLSTLLIIGFALLSRTGTNGIYTYRLLGAIYELLWLPLLAALFGIPLVWLVLAIKKKTAWSNLILPCILSGITILYLMLSQ
ncbi:hypothetical protein [Myroides fluvii]|uniref:hypothetical protein n=1 Tax=Myroides fluvii TaxID=2572594 RepID=UPI00131AE685|nr:hypothetical protein [Myroides fluvii]